MALIREYLPERAYIHELGVTDYETSLGRNLHQDFQKQKNIYILLNSDPHALVGLILASAGTQAPHTIQEKPKSGIEQQLYRRLGYFECLVEGYKPLTETKDYYDSPYSLVDVPRLVASLREKFEVKIVEKVDL
jgi:hypothetical protein